MNGINNLIVDFGGVIINLTRNRCIEAFAKIGVDVHEQLVGVHNHKDLFMQLELGSISVAEFRDGIRNRSNIPLTDQQIDEAWVAMLDDVPDYKLDLLLQLKRRYNIFLLSNTNRIHWEWAEKNVFHFKGSSVSDFFDKIYLSYELHLLKPDLKIYESVLDDSSIHPNETLFIDDALVNCKAAETMGFKTYNPEPREDWSFLFD